MNHTVIFDEEERDRRVINHLNEAFRHCRIGKVRKKVPPFKRGQPFRGLGQSMPWFPDPLKAAPTPMFMGKCGCRVGSACGNAACPHAVQVTCSA